MIERFKGEYRWLSNFWLVPVSFEGNTYKSVEHAYVASKTTSDILRFEVRCLATPDLAKTFGKTLPLRPDWEAVRLGIMEDLVRQKFKQPDLMKKLLQTGSQEIVEGNVWHDKFWGKCICPSCENKGENNLGKIIMKVREEIRQPYIFSFL